jgi:hypothetical protein
MMKELIQYLLRKSQFTQCRNLQELQIKKKVELGLSRRDDQGALSRGHELADSTLGELAAYF